MARVMSIAARTAQADCMARPILDGLDALRRSQLRRMGSRAELEATDLPAETAIVILSRNLIVELLEIARAPAKGGNHLLRRRAASACRDAEAVVARILREAGPPPPEGRL